MRGCSDRKLDSELELGDIARHRAEYKLIAVSEKEEEPAACWTGLQAVRRESCPKHYV